MENNLLQALKVCKPALGVPIVKGLDSYHFDKTSVSAFNGSLLISSPVGIEMPTTGAIEGNTLYKLINDLDTEIELSAPDATSLVVKSGRSKTKFPVETVDTTFLQDAEETDYRSYLPTVTLFAAGIKRCMSSLGGKGIASENIGIHVFIEDGECRMYSSNGYSCSRFIFPLENATDSQVFLPASFAENLLYLYAELGIEPTEVSVSDKYIRAKFGDVCLRSSFYSTPVNAELRQMIDQGIEEVGLVDLPESFSECIKRSEIVASGSIITLSFGDQDTGKLYVSARGAKNQEFSDDIDLPYPSSGSLQIDLRSIKKILESCKEVGFGEDYILLVGSEGFYDYIASAKSA